MFESMYFFLLMFMISDKLSNFLVIKGVGGSRRLKEILLLM
jgi:hypothetical protein